MNILLVCNKIPFPPNDGGSFATYNMARGLVEAGNQVDLLAMNTSKHYSREGILNTGIDGLNKTRDIYINNSVNYIRLFYNILFSTLPYNAECYIQEKFRAILKEMLRECDYQVVQLEGLYLVPYAQTIRDNSNAIIVYRAHNIEHVIWESYYKREQNLFIKWYLNIFLKRLKRFELRYINSYDLLVAVTETDLKILNQIGNERPAAVASFGMYPDEFKDNNYSVGGDFCLQYIGALDWRPNLEALDWFIDKVWKVLKIKYPTLMFQVAGRNAKDSYVKYLSSKGIEFMGEVKSSREFLSQSGIIVVPLFSGSGIRVRVIEAMYMGKPIISTSFAISGIPAEDGKQILLADDDNAFVRSVDKLISEPGYAIKLGAGAKDFSTGHYDNRTITAGLSDFYKNYLIC